MSLHRAIVLPPLALAIVPAPPPKPKEDKSAEKDKVKEDGDKDKQGKNKDVKDGKVNQGEEPRVKKDGEGDKGDEKINQGKDVNAKDDKAIKLLEAENASPTQQPGSPSSNIPEPGTPVNGSERPVVDEAPKVPAPNPSQKPTEVEEPEPKLEPLQLLGPQPLRPVRTRMTLGQHYPPINTDPRGAYHKYAKGVQAEWILIDVTKDGWLTEQWRERTEREALAKLRGEVIAQESDKPKVSRMVPSTSEEILLQLWNDLVEAKNHELRTEEFWSRYDWTDAQRHLIAGQSPEAAAWTREGLELTLATVGVQCSYQTEKPLPRRWTEPAGAYLILGHGYFMLRIEDYLQWKPEDTAGKYEPLVTSVNDRVFGEMVKAQKMKDAHKRKLAEKKKAEEAAKADKGKEPKKEGEKDAGKDPKVEAKEVGKEPEPTADKPDAAKSPAKDDKESPVVPKDEVKDGAKDAKPQTGPNNVQDIAAAVHSGQPLDPAKADQLAKMLKSGGDEVKAALKALELKKPVIWVWQEPVERWRWRNYEARVHEIGPGGWEERDWAVFADDRECIDFDIEAKWWKEVERDVHDWCC